MGNSVCCERNYENGSITIEQTCKTTDPAGKNTGITDNTNPNKEIESTAFLFDDHQQSKILYIQNEWRKKKDKERMVQRIRVLETNLQHLGKYVSEEEMITKTSPAILNLKNNLTSFKGSNNDRNLFQQNEIIVRRPFQYNYDSSIYRGGWNKNGMREGEGIYIKEDGTAQEGLWKDGKLFKGRIFDNDGCYYEGDIQDGEAHGIGVRYGRIGTYSGQWKEGKMFFLGNVDFQDNYKYNGIFFNGLFHGKGKFTWPDGSIYEGDFQFSSIKGSGKYISSNGEIYEGEWSNNVANGEGTYIHTGKLIGQKYEGCYKNGKKDGVGKYTFRNDSYYSGDWKNGLPNGKGEYKLKDTVYNGFWRNGILIYLNDDKALKNDISIQVEKEQFKQKQELQHLVDEIDGVINDITKPNKTYKASNYGNDLMNIFAKNHISKLLESKPKESN